MPLLPARPPSDGRYRSERQILEAIVHVACTQQSWPQLPQTLGSYKTCRLRYIRWRQDGTLARIATAHLPATDRTWQTALTRALSRYTAPRSRPTSRPHRRVRSRRRTHHL
jgi:transposase